MKTGFMLSPTGMGYRVVTAWIAAGLVAAGYGCGVQEHNAPGAASASGSGGRAQPVPGGTGGLRGQVSGSGGSGTGGRGTGGATAMGGAAAPGGTTGGGGSSASSGGAMGGPLSGITINIGGTEIPKEKAIAFVHFGHSNMRGQASTPAELRPFFYDTQPGLWVYRGAGNFQLAKEPTAPENATTMTAGPGMALLRSAAAVAPAGTQFISIGRGQGSAPSTDFLKGGLYYSTFMDRAMELKGRVTFGGIFVMLGITERHLPVAQQPGFPMRMQQIIASIRADLGEPNLPVYFCDYEQMATGTLAPTGSVGVVIMPLVRMLPALIPNLELVPTTALGMQDDHHFNFAGHKLWAERAIMIMQSKGWARWQL
jgi:hypothetical protein